MRPTILGTIIRRIDLHSDKKGSDKDYRITVSQVDGGGCYVYTEHGPAGKLRNGQERTASPVSQVRADQMADDYRDSKLKGGYKLITDQTWAVPTPAPQASAPAAAPTPPVQRPKTPPAGLSERSRAQYNNLF